MEAKMVLVVEDDPDLSVIIGIRLRREGYATVLARDAAEALVAVGRSAPDVILLDIGLPGEDGYAVLERLRGLGVATPVIMVSAYETAEHGPRSLAAGATAFLQKPIAWSSLMTALQVALVTRPLPSRRPSHAVGPMGTSAAAA
jgi:DNA-binding response OmpR family regulator